MSELWLPNSAVIRMAEDNPPQKKDRTEAGTTIDPDRVYRSWEDGKVFDLEQRPGPKEFRDMIRRDSQARQLAGALALPIRSAPFDIVATEGDKGERDFAEFALFASAMEGGMTTPIRKVLGLMSKAIVYRHAFFEKVWKVQDRGKYKGKHMLHKLAYRPPTTCTIKVDKNGSFDGFIHDRLEDHGGSREIVFSPKKSVVFIHMSEDEPILGDTAFENVYRNFVNKEKISFFYYAFLENVAFPKTIAKIAGDDPDELRYLLKKAAKLGRDNIVGLYEEETLEPYEAARNTRDYHTALEYLDWQMAKAVMGQFLDLGTSGERGSYALSQDKSKFFLNALEATLNDIADTINNYVISDLIKYNFGSDASFPKLRFRPLTDDSAEQVLELYRNVVQANAPNVTPPFLLKLMQRVSEILDMNLDPLADFDKEQYEMIRQTIPVAREHLESKESRAGSGQNPVTGKDRNRNNKLTPEEDARKKQGQSDQRDIVPDKKTDKPEWKD